jgi:hypothetical protein
MNSTLNIKNKCRVNTETSEMDPEDIEYKVFIVHLYQLFYGTIPTAAVDE